ncbi:MAG: glycosyltransferase, partial [Planctomycetota bacterium]
LPLIYFDIGMGSKIGKAAMNRRLREIVDTEKPDALFCVLFKDELDQATMRAITEETGCVTFNWFCDDHWRFDNFTRHWAPCFRFVSTTAHSALAKYEDLGHDGLIQTQWAANPFCYRPDSGEGCEHEATFVGRLYGTRGAVIEHLIADGLDVAAWGPGWDNGKLDQDQMIRVFSRSRVNINLTDAAVPQTQVSARIKQKIGRNLRRLGLFEAVQKLRGGPGGPKGMDDERFERAPQIKGRNFEVPACGGFLLTGTAERLGEYYEIGEEIVTFEHPSQIPEIAKTYLEDEPRRAAIARAGYDRTMREHTYVHRFCEIFERIGTPIGPPDSFLTEARLSGAEPAGELLRVEPAPA